MAAADAYAASETAINQALTNASVHSLEITATSILPLTNVLSSPNKVVSISGQVEGGGLPLTTLRGKTGLRILNVAKVTGNTAGNLGGLANLAFDRAAGDITPVTGNGGAVSVAGGVVGNVVNTRFSNQISQGNGSALYAVTFTGDLRDSVFANNTAGGVGAVFIGGNFTGNVTNVTFDHNVSNSVSTSAAGAGLVIYASNAVFTGNISNSTFTNNAGTGNLGGALSIAGTNAKFDGSLLNCVFDNNTTTYGASTYGAGASLGNMTGGVTGCTFTNNTATSTVSSSGSGGGFYAAGLQQGVRNSTFANNAVLGVTGGLGGAFYVGSGGFYGGVWNSTFTDNRAGSQGGAFYVYGKTTDYGLHGGIHNSTFTRNTAVNGGGAIIATAISDGIYDSVFRDNDGGTIGGAIAVAAITGVVSTGNLTGGIHNTSFLHNTAATRGTAVSVNRNFSGGIADSLFQDNYGAGAPTFYVSGTFDGGVANTSFIDNTAGASGYGGPGLVVMGAFSGDVAGSTFQGNGGGSLSGGALSVGGLDGSIVSSRFVDNALGLASGGAVSRGGAVDIRGTLTGDIRDTLFTGNSVAGTDDLGGAVNAYAIAGDITGSSFQRNSAGLGGALYVRDGMQGAIATTPFVENTAARDGGALYLAAGDLRLLAPSFVRNTAQTGKGGAVWMRGDAVVAVAAGETGLFSGNAASGEANSFWFDGGGSLAAAVDAGGTLDMRDPLSGNAAAGQTISIVKTGGGLWQLGGSSVFTADAGANGTDFSVNAGELSLYGAGAAANPTAADTSATVSAGTLRLDGAASVFSLSGAGTTLTVGGDNRITTDGSLILGDGTTIAAGAGNASGASSLALSAAGGTALGGNVGAMVAAGRSLTLDGALDGAGGLTKRGSGTLTLASANTATGAFTQAAGTVELARQWAGDYIQQAGTLVTGGNTLIGGDARFAGALDVGGADIGTLRVGGDLAFNGATLLVDLADDGRTADFIQAAGDVAAGSTSTVAVRQFRAGTFDLISGANNWDGTLLSGFALSPTLNGARSSATLQIDPAGGKTLQLSILLGNNTALYWTGNNCGATDGVWAAVDATRENLSSTADGATPSCFLGGDYVVFSGDGYVRTRDVSISGAVQAGGMEITSGDYVFSGDPLAGRACAALATAGGLAVSGGSATFRNSLDFAGGLTVAAGAAMVLGAGGSFTSGGGTVTVADGATLAFEALLDPAASMLTAGRIEAKNIAIGAATLEARISLAEAYRGTEASQAVMRAADPGGLTVSGAAILSGSRPFYSYEFFQSVGREELSLRILPVATSYAAYGSSPNSASLAGALDRARAGGAVPTGELAQAITTLLNAGTGGEAAALLREFSPAVLAGGTALSPLAARQFSDSLAHLLRQQWEREPGLSGTANSVASSGAYARLDPFAADGWRFWAQGLGDWSRMDSPNADPGYDATQWGGTLAAYRTRGDVTFGGAFALSHTRLDWEYGSGETSGNSYAGTLFASWERCGWFASLDAAYGGTKVDSKRPLPSQNLIAYADYWSHWYGADLYGGKRILAGDWQFTPGAGARWYRFDTPAVAEHGAGTLGLAMAGNHQTSLELFARLDVARTIRLDRLLLRPRAFAGVAVETADRQAMPSMTLLDPGMASYAFAGYSPKAGRTAGVFGIGLDAELTDRLTVFGEYQVELRDRFQRHTGQIGLGLSF